MLEDPSTRQGTRSGQADWSDGQLAGEREIGLNWRDHMERKGRAAACPDRLVMEVPLSYPSAGTWAREVLKKILDYRAQDHLQATTLSLNLIDPHLPLASSNLLHAPQSSKTQLPAPTFPVASPNHILYPTPNSQRIPHSHPLPPKKPQLTPARNSHLPKTQRPPNPNLEPRIPIHTLAPRNPRTLSALR